MFIDEYLLIAIHRRAKLGETKSSRLRKEAEDGRGAGIVVDIDTYIVREGDEVSITLCSLKPNHSIVSVSRTHQDRKKARARYSSHRHKYY